MLPNAFSIENAQTGSMLAKIFSKRIPNLASGSSAEEQNRLKLPEAIVVGSKVFDQTVARRNITRMF
jgi:hypothetical protein